MRIRGVKIPADVEREINRHVNAYDLGKLIEARKRISRPDLKEGIRAVQAEAFSRWAAR